MFSLHENTKTRLCRLAFLALCVAPTCAVLLWSTFIGSGWYRRAHERAIESRLGWQARLESVSTPLPGTLLYEGLEVFDHDTGQLFARLPFLEIHTSGESTVVRSPFPATVNGTRLDAFLQLMQTLARRSRESSSVRFEAGNLTLHLRDGDLTFTDISGGLEGDQRRAQATLHFRRAMAGEQTAELCQLSVTRHAGATSSAHEIRFSTGPTPLPAVLLAPMWPGVERLGQDCHFTGMVKATEQDGGWETKLSGRLDAIDLDLLISRQFPHKLSGLAQARLKQATFVGGRLENATGSMKAGPGVVSRSLLQSAEMHLHVQAAPQALHGRGNLVDYHLLCLGFDVGPQGMSLRGEVPNGRGAILVDRTHVMAIEPPVVSQPVVALVRTLVPHSDVQVPATRETVGLASALPVPTLVPAPGDERPLPHARPLTVRARPTTTGNPLRR